MKRDIKLALRQRFNQKAPEKPRFRAVICASNGSRTSGSFWFDENAKKVYVQNFGSGGIGPVYCERIEPQLGLGVIISPRDDRLGWEVVEDDKLSRATATDPRNYKETNARDLQPGGIKFMWLLSKAIQPLATKPAIAGGLAVDVVSGDYPYQGVRKSFAGEVSFALTQNPNPGEHYFAGLYLDSANSLQVVYGTSISTASDPPEPTWPAGAFQLSVVRVNDTQTSIGFSLDTDSLNDIFDRRMGWMDIDSFGEWPFTNVLTVSTTNADADYSTIQSANDAMASFDTILLDSHTFTEAVTLDNGSTIVTGWAQLMGSITSSGATTVNITASGIIVRQLRVLNTSAAITAICVKINATDTITLERLQITKASGAATTGIGIHIVGTSNSVTTQTVLNDLRVRISAGTTKQGVLIDTDASNVLIIGGTYNADTTDIVVNHASAVVHLEGPRLIGGGLTVTAGTVTGWYYDASDNIIVLRGNYIYGNISGTGRPNPIVNGAFLDWPRGTSFTSIANGAYTATQWIYGKVGTMVHDITQSTDVPTVAEAGVKVPYSVLIDCTTADAAIAAGDFTIYRHTMEGYNFLDIAQRDFILSFWVKATKTGVYCVAFGNSGGDRTWVGEYTVSVTDTWEFKTIAVTASPSAGTWDYTTGAGLVISFALAVGSTFQTTAGAWQTGNYLGSANQVNACDSASNNWRVALVDIAPGNVAPSPRLPDIETETGRCRRLAFLLPATGNLGFMGNKAATTNIWAYVKFGTKMRVTPTLSHNITGWTGGGLPTTTTVGAYNFATSGFVTITGALTVSLYTGSPEDVWILNQAGTSFSGTDGDLTAWNLGTGVVAVLSSEL